MPRYYVEKDGEWNIFSTVIDDFLFDEFICMDALKARLLYERFKELTEDLDSLLTDRPKVKVMSYEAAIECRHLAHDDEPEFSEDEQKCIETIIDVMREVNAFGCMDDLQTDCHRHGVTDADGSQIYECIGCKQMDCPWK